MRKCWGCNRRFSLSTVFGREPQIPHDKYVIARDMLLQGFGFKSAALKAGINKLTARAIERRIFDQDALCGCGRSRFHPGYCLHRANLHANARSAA